MRLRSFMGAAAMLTLAAATFADEPKKTDKDQKTTPTVKGGKTGTVGKLPAKESKDALKKDPLGSVTGGAALGKEGAAGKNALGGLPSGGRGPEKGGFGKLGQGGAQDRLGGGGTKPDPRVFGRPSGQSDGLDNVLPKQGRTGGDADRFRGRFGAPDPRQIGGLAGDGENGDGPDTST